MTARTPGTQGTAFGILAAAALIGTACASTGGSSASGSSSGANSLGGSGALGGSGRSSASGSAGASGDSSSGASGNSAGASASGGSGASASGSSGAMTTSGSSGAATTSGASTAGVPAVSNACLPETKDNVAAAVNPPGGLAPDRVPMFVMFGFDDNQYADGMNWVVKTLFGGKKNSDGSPAQATFFLTAGYATSQSGGVFITEVDKAGMSHQTPQDVVNSWLAAYAAGHEIGNHTWDHADGGNTRTLADWQTEIGKANDFITGPAPMGLGIPKCQLAGYRFPFLNFNDTGFQALQSAGLRYDTSIEFGYDWWIPPGMTMGFGGGSPESGKHYWWPFTLDNGVDPSFACCSKGVQAHPGLWEFPVHTFNRPDPSTPGGVKTCTGLDYNLWVTKASVDPTLDFCGTLKYSFDQRYNNNRAPMNVGCHSGIYSQWSVTDDTAFVNTYDVRRAALQCFVDYVLTFPDARIVSFRSVIEWMRSPKPLR
jgi:hypothetical protein